MTRDFSLKVKALADEGTFSGLASTYGGIDLLGDTIAPGAFKQAIASQGTGYPLLWSHNAAEPIGLGRVADSSSGLIVNGTLVMGDPAAQRALLHLKAGSIRGLSIGYQVPDGKSEIQSDGARLLREIKLYEISLVAIPADPRAQVFSVKDATAVLANLRTSDLAPVDRAELLVELKRLLGVSVEPDEDRTMKAEMLRELRSLAAEFRA